MSPITVHPLLPSSTQAGVRVPPPTISSKDGLGQSSVEAPYIPIPVVVELGLVVGGFAGVGAVATFFGRRMRRREEEEEEEEEEEGGGWW